MNTIFYDIQKEEAYQKYHSAQQDGSLINPGICSRCGSTEKVGGHHNDYSKPLDVIWCCNICHHTYFNVDHEHLSKLNEEVSAWVDSWLIL